MPKAEMSCFNPTRGMDNSRHFIILFSNFCRHVFLMEIFQCVVFAWSGFSNVNWLVAGNVKEKHQITDQFEICLTGTCLLLARIYLVIYLGQQTGGSKCTEQGTVKIQLSISLSLYTRYQ